MPLPGPPCSDAHRLTASLPPRLHPAEILRAGRELAGAAAGLHGRAHCLLRWCATVGSKIRICGLQTAVATCFVSTVFPHGLS